MGALPDALLALSLLGVAGWMLMVRSGLAAVAGFAVLGLLLALAWARLGAIDVAMTQAAIGAGATGAILLVAALRLRGAEAEIDAATPSRTQRVIAGVLCALLGAGLAAAMLSLPDPVPSLVTEAQRHLPGLGIANPVAGVLMAYRALDTLLQSVVIVLAVIAVWSMAPDAAWGGMPGPRLEAPASGAPALLVRVLAPVGIVIGIYVAWMGADAPGGKFPGGAILAAMWILAWWAGLVRAPATSRRPVRWLVVAGPLTFIAVGMLGFLVGDGFLDHPPGLARPLILLAEAMMALSVATGISLLAAGPPEAAA